MHLTHGKEGSEPRTSDAALQHRWKRRRLPACHCRLATERLRVEAMFQTFDETAKPQLARERIAGMRQKMQALGLDAYVVPRSDEFQGEYVAPASERLRWLTGFSGSAGVCVVTTGHAGPVTHGRHTHPARQPGR